MPFEIIRNDITKVSADAIVNSANPEPTYAGGTDRAIYMAAGADRLLNERRRIGAIAQGEAAATEAFDLPAKYIIHTVGPAWIDGRQGEFEILRACYRNSFELAERLNCKSIAFPLIATGVYGFPKDEALSIALSEIRAFLNKSDMDVKLVVFDRRAYQIASELTNRVAAYIDQHYVDNAERMEYGMSEAQAPSRRARFFGRTRRSAEANNLPIAPMVDMDMAAESAFYGSPKPKKTSLEDAVNNLGESFQARLMRMIDERGLSDPEVYKKANVDRKLFSKIRCCVDYIPKKRTILALAIALKLNIDDAKDLLASAGLALSGNIKSDVIVSFCIENEIYDIFEVNALLFKFDEPILP